MKRLVIAACLILVCLVCVSFAQEPEPPEYSGYPYFRATLIVEAEHQGAVLAVFPKILETLSKQGAAPTLIKLTLPDRTKRLPPAPDEVVREAVRDLLHNTLRWHFMSTKRVTATEASTLYVTLCNALNGAHQAGSIKAITGINLLMMPVKP